MDVVQFKDRMKQCFGTLELPHALYYHYENALRFDLGGEISTALPINRFRQAHGRACVVAQQLFKSSKEVFLLVANDDENGPKKKRLKVLRHCGLKKAMFSPLAPEQRGAPKLTMDGPAEKRQYWDVVQLPSKSLIPDILWLSVAAELHISPAFEGSTKSYLVDPSKGTILHVYDDRGMDVISKEAGQLMPLFRSHHDWLLKHDLPDMERLFNQP